ncbi:MAG: hypothetical protein H6811_01320 [Phycisphaeraceae bacterium]|nr:hypothetical protein [Phycisphaeraceae bacterium]
MTVAHQSYAVRWRDSVRWDIKSARATAFRRAHPHFRPLEDFAEEATVSVNPASAPDHAWPVYGVNNTSGVFLSHHQRGSDFNSTYKRIEKDWFFHNPTRANVGSLGRVPDVPVDAITSPEYQVWRLTGSLTPDFVEVLLHTRFFLDMVDCHRVGAVKERLFVSNLLEIPVPDVSPAQQRAIVAVFDRARQRAGELRARADALDAAAEADFLKALGLTPPAQTTPPKAFAVRWSEMKRWGVQPNQMAATAIDVHAGKYPAERGTEFLLDIRHGCSASPSRKPTGLDVLKISAATRGFFRPDERKPMRDEDRLRREFDLRAGDILMCRTNGTLAYVGMSALVEEDQRDLIFPDKLIRVRCGPRVLPAYYWKVTQMAFSRSQIEEAARTAVGNYAIGTDDLWALEIPLPPLPDQQRLIDAYQQAMRQAADLRAQAASAEQSARAEAEAMILGTRPVAAGSGR